MDAVDAQRRQPQAERHVLAAVALQQVGVGVQVAHQVGRQDVASAHGVRHVAVAHEPIGLGPLAATVHRRPALQQHKYQVLFVLTEMNCALLGSIVSSSGLLGFTGFDLTIL